MPKTCPVCAARDVGKNHIRKCKSEKVQEQPRRRPEGKYCPLCNGRFFEEDHIELCGRRINSTRPRGYEIRFPHFEHCDECGDALSGMSDSCMTKARSIGKKFCTPCITKLFCQDNDCLVQTLEEACPEHACEVDGCLGYCYSATKLKSGEKMRWCCVHRSERMCFTMHCNALTTNRYCKDHMCATEGCGSNAGIKIMFDKDIIPNLCEQCIQGKYCGNKTCTMQCPPGITSEGSWFCDEHGCRYPGCSILRRDKKQACWRHIDMFCLNSRECSNPTSNGEEYCSTCTSRLPKCRECSSAMVEAVHEGLCSNCAYKLRTCPICKRDNWNIVFDPGDTCQHCIGIVQGSDEARYRHTERRMYSEHLSDEELQWLVPFISRDDVKQLFRHYLCNTHPQTSDGRSPSAAEVNGMRLHGIMFPDY